MNDDIVMRYDGRRFTLSSKVAEEIIGDFVVTSYNGKYFAFSQDIESWIIENTTSYVWGEFHHWVGFLLPSDEVLFKICCFDEATMEKGTLITLKFSQI